MVGIAELFQKTSTPRDMSIDELANLVKEMRGLDEAGVLMTITNDYAKWLKS